MYDDDLLIARILIFEILDSKVSIMDVSNYEVSIANIKFKYHFYL